MCFRDGQQVLGEASERKIQQISLSGVTVKRRISEMLDDIMEQVIQEIKPSPTGMFTIQLNESTGVSSCAQLLAFVRYVFLRDIKDEYLFCIQLETTTTALDVMEKLTSLFTTNGITWKKICGGCTDGAPTMLGSKSGLQKHFKEVALIAKGVHCVIHRFTLASKTLPDALCKILEAVVKCVNFVKTGDLNSRFFQNLCRGMDSEHEALLFYSKVRWLSTGNDVNRVFELRGEHKLFLEMKGKDDLLSHYNEVLWEPRLSYLADIFEQLNRLNLKLQGKERNVFHHIDCIRAFLDKLQNWQRKVSAGNFAMFENISIVLDEIEEDHLLDPSLKNFIIQHLKSLESELKRYFPKFEKERKLVRNPFSGTLDIAVIPDDGQHEFLDLRNESAVRDLYEEKYLTVFWCSMYQSYPKLTGRITLSHGPKLKPSTRKKAAAQRKLRNLRNKW
ncbi:zinc finger BED domain-containing protein 5-like [Homarus americanus]|uniref:zinc finger BED domain-containing protein 5-like n=1 Tax=Homarus americanus TaxID=6706 RepID=UPI001C464CCF|nr:zinc finger BED domain-containing protein 5-like [Homarus americanus]